MTRITERAIGMKSVMTKIFAGKLPAILLTLLSVLSVWGAGELDPSYNATVSGGLNGSVYVFKVQPDGKILVGGVFLDLNGVAASGIGRLNSDLTVDASFNAPDIGGPVLAIGLQSNGKIIIGGNINGLKRLFPDGQLDTSFQPPVLETPPVYYDIEVLPNDQILAG